MTFTLLDKPPPIGDVVHPKTEPDLKTVASRLTDAINKGTFVVNFKPDGSLKVCIMCKIEKITIRNIIIEFSRGLDVELCVGVKSKIIIFYF